MTYGAIKSLVTAGRPGMTIARDEAERLALDVDGQRVVLENSRAFDEPWLVALAPIAAEEEVHKPLDALEWNGRLAAGALAIVDGVFVLRWATPLAALDTAAFERTLRFIASEALRIAEVLSRLAPTDGAVRHFAD